MFKITNGEASAFNSPVLAKLFTDENRKFPIEDAFKLSDMIQVVVARMEPYRTALKKIIAEQDGEADENGFVRYPSEESRDRAKEEIDRLNAIENEYPGELITPGAGWPNLTLAEATILRPLLNGKPKQ